MHFRFFALVFLISPIAAFADDYDKIVQEEVAKIEKRTREENAAVIEQLKQSPNAQKVYSDYSQKGGKLTLDEYLVKFIAGNGSTWFENREGLGKKPGKNNWPKPSESETKLWQELVQKQHEQRIKTYREEPQIQTGYQTYVSQGGKMSLDQFTEKYLARMERSSPAADYYRHERNIGKKRGDPGYEEDPPWGSMQIEPEDDAPAAPRK